MIKNKTELDLSSPGKRLKFIRTVLLRISREYMKTKYHIPHPTIKAWENSISPLTASGARRCIKAFLGEGIVVREDWLLEGIGSRPKVGLLHSYYLATPINVADQPLENDEACMLRDAMEFKQRYTHSVIMLIADEDMSPFYKPGDYVGGKIRLKTNLDEVVGKVCIVYLKSGERLVRKIIKNKHGGYNLICLNSNTDTPEPVLFNTDIEAAAPIIWHRRKD